MFFLHRSKAVISVAAAILMVGLWVAVRIPLEWSPNIELPVVRISAVWPGSSPRSVERYIAAPIERAVQSVQGTLSVESLSEEGRTTVTLEMDPDADLATYIAEINDQLSRLHSILPDRVRPFLSREVPEALRDEQGFMTLQLVGPLTPEAVLQLAEKEVAPKFESIEGLEGVQVRGGAGRELRITLSPERMRTLSISPSIIQSKLLSSLTGDVFGRIRESGRATLLLREPEENIEALRQLVISRPGDSVVRLRDIAEVQMASAPVYSISRVDGQPVVTLTLSRSRNAHMIATSMAVRDLIAEIELPDAVRLLIVDDRAESVREQLYDLAWRGGLGLVLVVFVLLFMLKSIRAAGVVLFSVFVSLSVAFLLLAAFDMTLNLLTIAGLVLVFGLLVDNSVVIVEQIQKKGIAFERRGWEAKIRDALREVWLPLLGGTLSTIAVLIPLVYLSGELRALFLPFGVLVSITLGVSLVCAATLVPVLMRYVSQRHRRMSNFGWRMYRWPCFVAARFPRITLLCLILLVGFPLWLLPSSIDEPESGWSRPVARLAKLYNNSVGDDEVQIVLKSIEPWIGGVLRPFSQSITFGPSWNYEQRSELYVNLGFPSGNPIERADSLMIQFERIALASSAVSGTIVQIGERRASMRVQFYDEALLTSEPFIVHERLIQRAVLMGGVLISVGGLLPEGYYSGGGGTTSGIRIEALGPNYEDLEELTERFADRLKGASRRVFDVNTNAGRFGFTEEREVVRYRWDADSESRTGVSASEVSSRLRPMLSTRFPMYYADLEGEVRVPVRLFYRDSDQLDMDQMQRYPLRLQDSIEVKLGGVAFVEIQKTPSGIERVNQQYKRYIQVDYRGPFQMASAFMEAQLAAMPVPTGYVLERSNFVFFDEEVKSAYGWVMLGALLLVFLITAAVFESWRLPLLIILALPMALFGVALGFLWSGASFAEGAFIGSVLLIGIAVNDSILLVDRYRQIRGRRPGLQLQKAMLLAIKDRLRPMWATTLTSCIAMLPLLVFPDEGDFWMGLAVTVVAGLVSATILIPLSVVSLNSDSWW